MQPIHAPDENPIAPLWIKNNFNPKVMPQPNITLSTKLVNKKKTEEMHSTEKLLWVFGRDINHSIY